jgi:NNP family nitrate/nitrite transporter-like MFS transporter
LVSGIVGAGGNLGGMLFGFLFKSTSISYVQAFTYIGFIVITVSIIILITKFQKSAATEESFNAPLANSVV